jgi:hypothetical protein
METTTEIKPGDKVRLVGGTGSPEWDGLRAVIHEETGRGGWWVKMDAGDRRADGYDHEPFIWDNVKLRSEDDVAQDPGGPDEVLATDADGQALDIMVKDLEDEKAKLEERIEYLNNRVNTLIQEKSAAEVALEDFKQTVTQVAVRYAREYDWCSVVRSALEEMGLETTVEQRIRVSGYVTALVPVCGEEGDIEADLRINGDTVDLYDVEFEFDTDAY